LGFAQKISRLAIRQPEQIILFSPWLDASMSNTEIAGYDGKDKLLSIAELKLAGKTYAGNLEVTDFRISPIYGDFAKVGRISIFTGSHDVLFPDALKLRRLMERQHHNLRFYEYPGMFHDWVLFPFLEETKDVIAKVVAYPVFQDS
jgi:acetyl esterase/lipase